MTDDVSSEAVDAVEFVRVDQGTVEVPHAVQHFNAIQRYGAAEHALRAFGDVAHLEEATKAVARIDAKAMTRRK